MIPDRFVPGRDAVRFAEVCGDELDERPTARTALAPAADAGGAFVIAGLRQNQPTAEPDDLTNAAKVLEAGFELVPHEA